MTFDEWQSTHPPMQTESPNAYARRAFNAGVRSQAECAPRYAVRLFKDALIDRFDQYPIPSQLGVTAIMKVIKQFHDGYTTPQAECASRAEDPDWMGKLPKCTEWPSGVAPRAEPVEESDVRPRERLCGGSHISCNGVDYCLGHPSCRDIAKERAEKEQK